MEHGDDPEITPLLYRVTAVESVVLLVAGVGLLLVPSVVGPRWPWELTPFNALLLGSIYSGSLVATAMTVKIRRWAPARVVVPMIFLFTSIVLIVSVMNLDRFELSGASTWLWFFLYVAIPLNALYHLWLYRHLTPRFPHPLPEPWRAVILLPVIVLGLYGVGLLVAPTAASSFWPWGIDAFHGRMYSVLYLTPALGAVLLWKAASNVELLTLGQAVAFGGMAPIVGLPIIDTGIGKVDCSTVGTWAWIASFAVLLLAGLGLVWRSRSQEPATAPVPISTP